MLPQSGTSMQDTQGGPNAAHPISAWQRGYVHHEPACWPSERRLGLQSAATLAQSTQLQGITPVSARHHSSRPRCLSLKPSLIIQRCMQQQAHMPLPSAVTHAPCGHSAAGTCCYVIPTTPHTGGHTAEACFSRMTVTRHPGKHVMEASFSHKVPHITKASCWGSPPSQPCAAAAGSCASPT